MRMMARDNDEGRLSGKDMDKVQRRGQGTQGATSRWQDKDIEEGSGQGTTTTRDIRK